MNKKEKKSPQKIFLKNYGELGESSLFAMENEERARYLYGEWGESSLFAMKNDESSYLLWRMMRELVINYGE